MTVETDLQALAQRGDLSDIPEFFIKRITSAIQRERENNSYGACPLADTYAFGLETAVKEPDKANQLITSILLSIQERDLHFLPPQE